MKSSAVGTYTFDGDYIKGTALVYVTKNFNATGGTITITEKTDSKVSGKFEATGTGNGITKVYGTFTGIGEINFDYSYPANPEVHGVFYLLKYSDMKKFYFSV
jgi:hypothetical protein